MSSNLSIKKAFIPSNEGWTFMEVDASQLEVYGLAILSKDKQLKQDLRNGIDLHSVSAEWVTGIPYKEILEGYLAGNEALTKIRKDAKRPRFELQYGASSKTIARNNNWSLAKAMDYIDRYYLRYSGIKDWHRQVEKEVMSNTRLTKNLMANGQQERVGTFKSITGRHYDFKSVPSFSGGWRFLPTQVKNYPNQGFATGDLFPILLGIIYYKLIDSNDEVELVNTRHDDMLLQYSPRVMPLHIKQDINAIVNSDLKEFMSKWFEIDLDIPLRMDYEVGPSWGELKPLP